MQARDVAHPNQLLASPASSLVMVRCFIPPAAKKGDPLDIEVRVPAQCDTTSLYGGWLMETRMKERAMLGGQMHDGNVLALGEGALLVDPQGGADDKVALLRARVLGGGRVLKDRTLGLSIKPDEKSVYVSKQIGDALNRRFYAFSHGTQQGVATPKTDEFVELTLHPHYRYNIPRVHVRRAFSAAARIARRTNRPAQVAGKATPRSRDDGHSCGAIGGDRQIGHSRLACRSEIHRHGSAVLFSRSTGVS